MRLLFLSNLYPPHEIGGFEQWCQEVAGGLRRRGHQVEVLTSRHQVDSANGEEPGVRRSLNLQADIEYYRPLDFFLRRPARERHNQQALRDHIAAFRPDVVLVWGLWNLSRNLAWLAEQILPGRVAYYVASYWPQEVDMHLQYWQAPARRPLTRALKRPLRQMALRQLRLERDSASLEFVAVRCCSRYVRDALVGSGTLPEHAAVLYGGIDLAPFRAPQPRRWGEGESLELLYFGSLVPHKGVHTAVEALGLLKPRGVLERLHLTVIGSGRADYRRRLEALAHQLGVSQQVHFAGRVARGEIPDRLRGGDVFLFTSTWAEPMARSVMEAMAAGLLVIGAPVGGQAEMLQDGRNALTFPAGDAAALAAQIERALNDPGLCGRLAAAGRKTVFERFDLDRMVLEVEGWLEEIARPQGFS